MPPDDIRPGLSCSAKIVTATRRNALSIPIQALTVRKKVDLEAPPKDGVMAANVAPNDKSGNEEIQGVFVVNNGRAEFRKVDTGITGATDIEVLERAAGRRPDHHRQLQSDPHHPQRRARQSRQSGSRCHSQLSTR